MATSLLATTQGVVEEAEAAAVHCTFLPTLREDGSLICTAPVNSVAGEVEVDVTLNGMQYATTGKRFASLISPPAWCL